MSMICPRCKKDNHICIEHEQCHNCRMRVPIDDPVSMVDLWGVTGLRALNDHRELIDEAPLSWKEIREMRSIQNNPLVNEEFIAERNGNNR